MGKKRHKAEEIVAKSRQVAVITAQARPAVMLRSHSLDCRELDFSVYLTWTGWQCRRSFARPSAT